MIKLDESTQKSLLIAQKNEITEYHLYSKLADSIKNRENARILEQIAEDEREHYVFWRTFTSMDVKPSRWKVFRYYWISRIFGITFGLKLMEKGEEQAQITYDRIAEKIPEAHKIVDDEDAHEKELLALIEEELLKYVGSVVLGLNDALVELTGALAGLTFALQNTRLTALAGLITGIAASFSMAASEYLSTKSEGGDQSPLKSSIYTGVAYIFTVFFLIFPYLIFTNYLFCLAFTIVNAILVILVFNFYVSVAKDLDFGKRFIEMASISLGIALVSFGIGYVIRLFLGIEI
jgi:VIT1/CCC1 family predicted Fe2+/Mn2+ transporter